MLFHTDRRNIFFPNCVDNWLFNWDNLAPIILDYCCWFAYRISSKMFIMYRLSSHDDICWGRFYLYPHSSSPDLHRSSFLQWKCLLSKWWMETNIGRNLIMEVILNCRRRKQTNKQTKKPENHQTTIDFQYILLSFVFFPKFLLLFHHHHHHQQKQTTLKTI